ncbi:GNAT family N-acetyltransferase [Pedobacter polaris]|uniref:GNAT family N-acetyltransferase n=1 Tax=Pedobacter polaris TaxID=2571273 RepID=A0A4U1CGM2_9SPHI|nr:GNAT family N-acetyltransferase [Pedobacter polaris]TKC05555.1 GNAT family N-acetyltransferase [Pedobacter polaris]
MISSQNLILKPLSHNQLIKYIANDDSLERELKLNPTKKVISPELREALAETILPNVADTGKNHLFSTLWTIILKAESRMVGDICFVGEPTEDGEIEIGYGTYENFRGKGYMTEAVACIIDWAKRQDNVKSIFAQTAKDNPASWHILEKNNFEKVNEDGNLLSWRLKF